VPPQLRVSRPHVVGAACLLAYWVVLVAVVVGVGWLVVHVGAVDRFDRHVTAWAVAHRTPALDRVFRAVTSLGSWVAVVVAGVVVAVPVLRRRLPAEVLVAFAVAWAGEYGAVNLGKFLVGRARPPRELWLVTAHGASFPSGHAANAALVGGALVALAVRLGARTPVRRTAVVLACLGTAAVAWSRVQLGVHWTSDVVAGVLVTVAWLVAVRRWVPTGTGAPDTDRADGTDRVPAPAPSDPAADGATTVR